MTTGYNLPTGKISSEQITKAKEELENLIGKAQQSSFLMSCDIYWSGMKYGMKDFWRILDSEFVGEKLVHWGE